MRFMNYIFPVMKISERKKLWCDSIGKSIYYADDVDEKFLDKIGFPKRRFFFKWVKIFL